MPSHPLSYSSTLGFKAPRNEGLGIPAMHRWIRGIVVMLYLFKLASIILTSINFYWNSQFFVPLSTYALLSVLLNERYVTKWLKMAKPISHTIGLYYYHPILGPALSVCLHYHVHVKCLTTFYQLNSWWAVYFLATFWSFSDIRLCDIG